MARNVGIYQNQCLMRHSYGNLKDKNAERNVDSGVLFYEVLESVVLLKKMAPTELALMGVVALLG